MVKLVDYLERSIAKHIKLYLILILMWNIAHLTLIVSKTI